MGKHRSPNNQNGMIMVVGLLFLSLLTLLAATAFMMSSGDMGVSAAYKNAEKSFNNAEAGIQFGIAKLEIALKSGLVLPPSGSIDIPGAVAPPGFSFIISPLTIGGRNSYDFLSAGYGPSNASSKIQIGCKQAPALGYGAFGDVQVEFQSGVRLFSYDSRIVFHPVSSDSTGKADVASNGTIYLKTGTLINGDVILGHNGESAASALNDGTAIVSGREGIPGPIVNTDPLDVRSAGFKAEFDDVMMINDNSGYINPFLAGPIVENPAGGITFSGKSGGSVFYLEKIDLSGSHHITIDVADGPVTIFLRGSISARDHAGITVINADAGHEVILKITDNPLHPQPWSQAIVDFSENSVLNPGGLPTCFTLLTDSERKLAFRKSTVNSLVYAPDGKILMVDSEINGAVWGKSLEADDNAVLYVDTALDEKYLSERIIMTSWVKL